ncbi:MULTISPECIES: PLP-dependent aminotransferase family protein [unclassified Fusibacter]|uniref:aminotransferase-like domain-containing protein n=1 Tax=unclassified Fusibacter TaxID=2624464 RepID=UPI0010121AA2|nr:MULTISPECIES: PLP-dependent aminotransferase family protein [unclassified Fusibacter]MCK8059566.1 PLP-dependent aminotransferase family protein [Fusibacter sp. A2]NPE21367.1 PLP-dependent aminotransferase family protein [Fusibacter sp. A1]RXV61783.1 PLP-dependent aminotransferase family protein [Fusibacter sp. A1]
MEKFRQIQATIMSEIAAGKLKKGDKLLSIREGAKVFGASPATVLKAYESLISEHVVYNQPRKGYFVIDEPLVTYKRQVIDFRSPNPTDELLPFKDFKQCVSAAMNTYEDMVFQYANALGIDPLRKIIAHQLVDNQVFVTEEEVAITSGSQQAIDILFKMTYPNGGKVILLEQPTYPGALRAAENNRQEVIFVERGMNGLDLERVEKIFRTKDVKCFYVMPRYHNPTGHTMDVAAREKLYELACRYNVYLIEDDYLVDLDNCVKTPPIKHFDTEGRVIYVKTFSKVFMPGLRIGAVVLPKRIKEAFKVYKQWSDISTNALSQGALEVYLRSGMFLEHITKAKKAYTERGQLVRELVHAHNDPRMTLTHCEGSILGSLTLSHAIHFDQLLRQLEAQGIMMSDTRYGFHPYYQQNNLIRLTWIRVNTEQIKEYLPIVLAAISKALDKGYDIRRVSDYI